MASPDENAAQRARGALFETAIHDLKNPIAIVRMNLEWARGQLGGADPEVVDALQEAQSATHTMLCLVEALLLASRIETKTAALRDEPVDLARIARASCETLARELEERRVTIAIEGEATDVSGDAMMIAQAVGALLRVLIRRTPRGGDARLVVSQHAGAVLRATSAGKPLGPHERDFGLYLCALIAEAHGGSFEAIACEEAPLCFVMRLPSAAR